MDDDDKINLEFIVALIRHLVMKEDVSAFPVCLAVFVLVFFVYVTWPNQGQMVSLL